MNQQLIIRAYVVYLGHCMAERTTANLTVGQFTNAVAAADISDENLAEYVNAWDRAGQ